MQINVILFVVVMALSAHLWAGPENTEIVIRSISIDNQNIFDMNDSKENSGLYRAANYLHFKTRKSVILKNILFSVGDAYSSKIIEESERILRGNRYLRAAVITAKVADSNVDIYITTKDTWSTKPSLSYDRKADATKTKISLEEDNLLGYGIHSGIELIDDPERSKVRLKIYNKNVLSTRYNLNLMYSSNSDGDQKSLSFERPFYQLNSTHAQGFYYDDLVQIDSLYDRNGKIYSYRVDRQDLDIYKGWSSGSGGKYIVRHKVGFHSNTETFTPTPTAEWQAQPTTEILPSVYPENIQKLPENRYKRYPYYAIELIEDNFIKTYNFEQIGRTEDRHVGLGSELTLGYAGDVFDSKNSNFIAGLTLSDSYLFTGKSSLNVNLKLDFQFDSSVINNIYLDTKVQYFFQFTSNWQTYFDYEYRIIHDLDYRKQLYLGGSSGLRGYPEHFVSGTKISKFTLEERYFSNLNPWRIWNIGAAVFFDSGMAKGDFDLDRQPNRIYSDVGAGLRIANNRSSLGSIIHLDVAFPLNAPEEIGSYQISLTAKKTF